MTLIIHPRKNLFSDLKVCFNSGFDAKYLERVLDTNYRKSDLDVHDEDQLDDIDEGKPGGHEQAHPHCTLYYHFQCETKFLEYLPPGS